MYNIPFQNTSDLITFLSNYWHLGVTTILVMKETIFTLKKVPKYIFQMKSYSIYKSDPSVKLMMIVASDVYILDILGPYLADGKITTQ